MERGGKKEGKFRMNWIFPTPEIPIKRVRVRESGGKIKGNFLVLMVALGILNSRGMQPGLGFGM